MESTLESEIGSEIGPKIDSKIGSKIGSDLIRLVRCWRSIYDEKLKPEDLTQTHWITLHKVSSLPPEQSQIDLARAIGIEQPSLVRTLDQLEDKELITRHTCANDRRAKRIKLTEKSGPIIKKVDDVIADTLKEILKGISENELVMFSGMIDKIEQNIIQLQSKP